MNLTGKSREKLLVLLTAAVIGLLAVDRLVLTPLAESWKERSSRIANRTKDVTNGRLLLAREQALRQRWQTMQDRALPPLESQAQAQVYNAVERWLQESGASSTSQRPQWRQHEDYVTLDWRSDVFGDINAIARFLYELEKDPLPLRIEEMDITARDNQGGTLALTLRFSGLTLASHLTQGGQP